MKRFNLPSDLTALILILMTAMVMAGCNGGGGGDGVEETGLTARFTMTPDGGSAPLNIYFDASASQAPEGEAITEYGWDFGDGSTGSGTALSHLYRQEGTYTITLTVMDSLSDQALSNRTLVVDSPPASAKLSGTITIASGTMGDSDTNDPNAPYKGNDSFEEAQEVVSPMTLGGYVNQPFKGAPGRSFLSGDPLDYFRVILEGEETISLSFADSFTCDLDLYLYDETYHLVDGSKNIMGLESITAPASGTYYILVYAYQGASSYILTLGRDAGVSQTSEMHLGQEFVPGEAIVQLKENARAMSGGAEQNKGPRLLKFTHTPSRLAASSPAVPENVHQATAGLLPGASEALLEKDRTLNLIKELKKRDDILTAEPNFIRKPFAAPIDTYYDLQWHYPLIQLPQAWDITQGSSQVVTAVIDTGVLTHHPDLSERLTPGYDFISSSSNAMDGDGIDSDPDDPGDMANGSTSSFHGTHVAGTIGAASNNDRGVSGIAWESKIMPLRALGRDGGTTYDIVQALRFAGGLSNDSGRVPTKPADVINMSFGSGAFSQAEQNIISILRQKGIIMVGAAGNESTSQRNYPAAYDGVLAVSAVTIEKKPAWYANFGSWIDLSAPGGDTSADLNGDGYPDGVLSTGGDDSQGEIQLIYTFLQGTSMAAPHVAGIMALMKSIHPELTHDQVTGFLAAGELTDDTGAPGRDDSQGWGLINAQKCVTMAVRAAQGDQPDDAPLLVVTPGALNFGASASTLTISATNGGTGSLTMEQPSTDQPWLTITPENIDGNSLGSWTAAADRSELTTGISHTAVITFHSSVNNVTIPVTLYQPAALDTPPDLGTHYIQIVNTETHEVAQVEINAGNGAYAFTFNGIAPGIYQLYAGSDTDNNGFILGSWEASGGYKTLSNPSLIYLNQDMKDLDFFTGYNFAMATSSSAGPSATPKIEPIKKITEGP